MPAVTKGTVLVSGASGFIAVHVVQELLTRGYTVRGTVRSSEKGDWLANKFKGKGDFTYTIVEDLEKEGGFDEAVKGIDAVLHTASPFHFKAEDPYNDLVNPAVNGTLSILQSIKKHGGDRVKRVVITSSYAAVLDTRIKPVHTFTEADWNENSPAELERLGKDVDQPNAYRASKTLAERAAWKFVEEQKPGFDLVTVNPPFVLGPVIHQVNKPDSLNTSVAAWYAFLNGTKSGDDAGPAGNEVDVRDLAKAHVQAIAVEEAGGNRFAITNQAYSWQDALDIANENKEIKEKFSKLPKGTPGAGKEVKQNLYDGTKSKNILKIDYIPLEKTIIDMSKSLSEYEAAGWKV